MVLHKTEESIKSVMSIESILMIKPIYIPNFGQNAMMMCPQMYGIDRSTQAQNVQIMCGCG